MRPVKRFEELTRPQQCAQWALIGAIAANMVVDVWAYFNARNEQRNWNRAIHEDMETAKAETANADTPGE
jgi:hypothetical protein